MAHINYSIRPDITEEIFKLKSHGYFPSAIAQKIGAKFNVPTPTRQTIGRILKKRKEQERKQDV